MSIRDQLKKREQEREERKNQTQESDLPEGVSRYIQNRELKDGRTFIILDDPDDWYFYYVHEDSSFSPRETYVKKHSCLHSPRDIHADFEKYARPGKSACPSCAAGVKRKLYFIVRLFDVEYGTWRVFDTKEFHVLNLIEAYDKIEKTARKFNKNYSLIGDVVTLRKSDKTFTLESSDFEVPAEMSEKVKAIIDDRPNYADLAYFRSVDDVVAIVEEAAEGHADKSALAAFRNQGADAETDAPQGKDDSVKPIENDGDGLDNLPF
ncbi:single-stranded DNA-binding protein [Thermoactinomyces vulgaris]|jgi:hypothetical protein|uniref:single-stranded DNA-binding protein n=1 Tax=Thermoactinomyces vulgaris TaxID=2026 RepID=UPI00362C1473